MDFLRFLRGGKKLEHIEGTPKAEIPLRCLDRSYRNHQLLAKILRKWVYERKDGIPFHSTLKKTIKEVKNPTIGLNIALDPEYPIVLILHEDRGSQQANPVEAEIVHSLVKQLNEEVGVVTPHNA